MELHDYLAFFVATAIMIALPGPSVLLTVAHSISFGWKHALSTVAGATTGIAVQLIVAAIGLTSLLNLVADAFEWLRWAGAAYLVYLGIKQWRSASEPPVFETSAVSKTNLFVQGLVITIPNPKSLIFIAAFLPQFIDSTRPLGLQFSYIVPTFLVITFTVTSVWALAAGKISGVLQNQRAFRSVLRTAGGLMIIAGAGLALARRGN
ncbi:LysE family translocator [uncultured Desulfosarcina sp.]|uniref:LysE family translocator n=1 Tax=uncultured Desulfosarcina sp. TaxID=218289 RepID=UPI0029C6FD57|nr:LysE family translocator [uncultured Desulfosarcina sp.]